MPRHRREGWGGACAPGACVQAGAPRKEHEVKQLAVQVGQGAALREALEEVRRDVGQADAAEGLREVGVPDELPARLGGGGVGGERPREVDGLAEVVVPRDGELCEHFAEAVVALGVACADLNGTRAGALKQVLALDMRGGMCTCGPVSDSIQYLDMNLWHLPETQVKHLHALHRDRWPS